MNYRLRGSSVFISFYNILLKGSQNPLLQEHDSVMLGAISPHNEYCDSKSSTETPPSYTQLNYNEKLERFFKSKPLCNTTFGSDEDNMNSSGPSNDNIGKSSKNLTGTKDTSPTASGSGGNLSSSSNVRTSYDSRDDSESFKPSTLTESLLNMHNIDMEKLMTKQYKERRSDIKKHRQHKDSRVIDSKKKSNNEKKGRKKSRNGKRCGSRSHSRGYSKVSKYDGTAKACATVAPVASTANHPMVMPMSVDDSSPPEVQSRPNMNMWSSGPVTARPQQTSQLSMPPQNIGFQEALRSPAFSPIVPLYYLPVPQIREESMNPMTHPVSNQFLHNSPIQQNTYVSYVPAPLASMIYPPMVCALAPAPTMYRQFATPRPAPILRETLHSNSVVRQQENSAKQKRPESQATSVKAEPGSTMAMSESSKKVLSQGEHFSSCVSIDGGCSSLVAVQTTANTKRETISEDEFESSLEDSSDSSFYGGFLNTTSSSSCNPDQNARCTSQESLWKPATLKPTENYKEQQNILQKEPLCQENVKLSPELTYQNHLTPKPLDEVIEADKKTLRSVNRPRMVHEQLTQLYSDVEIGGWKMKPTPSDGEKKSKIGSESSQEDMPEVRNCQGQGHLDDPQPPATS